MSGSQKSTTDTSSSAQTSPWGPQKDALKTAFTGAQGALTEAQKAEAPTDFVSQFTPEQLSTFRSMLGYANTSNVAANNNATGDALATAGTNGLTGALSGLMDFNPTDHTDANITNAMKYADNPAIPGMVASAMRDATQTARDVTLPGMTADAAHSGNINSTRTGPGGIAEGLVTRGLAQRAGDISADLRGRAFEEGLNRSSNENQFNVGSLLDSLKSAGSLAGGAASAGVAARSGSVGDAGNTFNIANAGGSGLQAADQAKLDNLQARYEAGTTTPFDALQEYMSIVGSNNWGSNTSSTGTQTTTTTPSAWQVASGLLGAAGSGAGLAGGLGWKPFA